MSTKASPENFFPPVTAAPEPSDLQKARFDPIKEIRLSSAPVPNPRLLSSLEPIFPWDEKDTPENDDSPFVLGKSSIWSGNGRAIFIGILIGALLLIGASKIFHWQQDPEGRAAGFSKFLKAQTHSLSASPQTSVTPAPIVIPFSTDLIHVTAIALGHPRLAVVNGQSVAEGDSVRFRLGAPTVTVSLRVVKIGDGRIDFTDGQQTITARLLIASKNKP